MYLDNMNAIIALLLLVLPQPTPFNTRDSTTITGTISAFQPGATDGMITFYMYDIQGNRIHLSFPISANGHYKATLLQAYEGDLSVYYREHFANLYTRPGGHLVLDMDGDGKYHAGGELGAINNEVMDFFNQFYQQHFPTEVNLGSKMPDSAFAAARRQRLHEELDFLEAFAKQSGSLSPPVKAWLQRYLTYEAANDLITYPFFGKRNTEIDAESLLSYLGGIPVVDEAALSNASYYRFLNWLTTGMNIITNLNPANGALLKEDSSRRVSLPLDWVDEAASVGITRDLMYYDEYNLIRNLRQKESTSTWNRCYDRVGSAYIKNCFMVDKSIADKGGFTPFELQKRLQAFAAPDNVKQRLDSLFGSMRGQTTFVDFWGTWCGACMAELPDYPDMIAHFKGAPVHFLFLSDETTDSAMHAVQKKFGIDATFFNITADENTVLGSILGFSGYPHHYLLDAKGLVVAECWGPGSGTETRIRQQLKVTN
jgi:thiol-disulfide isomerase/thioredoxin